jgi:hypothetical protein
MIDYLLKILLWLSMMRCFLAFCLLIQYGFAHSRAYNTAFQDEFLRQERQYLAASGLTSPAPLGYIPVTITNNSTLADTEIYVLILTNNNYNIITFTNTLGQMLGQQTTPPPMTYVSAQSSGSYTLNSFNNGSGAYIFYLPITVNMANSRIYFSIGGPLDWFIRANGPVQVSPLDFIDLSQDGYYTVYDKIEFNLNANSTLTINPTLVDYYGIPLSFSVSASGSTSYAGLPPSLASTTIFSTYNTAAAALPATPNSGTEPNWAGLSLTYQAPSGMSPHPLRVLSGGSALKSGNPIVATPAYANYSTFNNYYLSANNYIESGCNWFTNVWDDGSNSALYQTAPVFVDLSVAGPGSGVATGLVDNSGNFIFTVPSSGCGSGGASGFSLTLPIPTTSLPFYTGSLNDYTPAPTIQGPQAYATVLWEIFSAAILAGIVPLTGTSCSSPLSENYIRSQTLFQPNANLTCTSSPSTNPPWYDFYSQTFLGMGTGQYTKYYTFPYADVWQTDGTITVTNLPTANTQIVINIGSMSGIVIPDPFNDANSYMVTFTGLPGDGTTVTFGSNPNYSQNPQISQGVPYMASGGSMYMGVTYSTGPYAGQIWGTHIIPSVSTPALKPVLPGVITITQSSENVSISVGASPGS